MINSQIVSDFEFIPQLYYMLDIVMDSSIIRWFVKRSGHSKTMRHLVGGKLKSVVSIVAIRKWWNSKKYPLTQHNEEA
jgi:hypothetical protein